MKLKLTPEGHAVVVDGKPVYVHDDGKEIPFDAVGTVARISALNAEARGHREAKEAAEAKAKAFDGLDPEAARKAVETVKNIDDKKLVDAGQVEQVRAAAVKAYEDRLKAAETTHASQLNELNSKLEKVVGQLHGELIGGNFARSKFIADKVAIPADMVQAAFGRNFKVEDGKVAAYDNAGNRIFSRTRPGDPNVDFDEALEILVDSYPHKAAILKGSGASGGGAQGGSGAGGKKTYTRAQIDNMSPADAMAASKAIRSGEAVISD
ncbi:hypothetical protein AAW51_2140 [Caldimonas brevitalea]|uniref:DUF6651 domain-containing protein n=2 Tax=Caldimonas brevitalea TaxID=413882 RepID=A0A0G3BNA6_9BURK|nr:hypothetical protein AAW51_2140 [Caldimonas brevitalea]